MTSSRSAQLLAKVLPWAFATRWGSRCLIAQCTKSRNTVLSLFDRIASKFDAEDGIVHDLTHKEFGSHCMCIACLSRASR